MLVKQPLKQTDVLSALIMVLLLLSSGCRRDTNIKSSLWPNVDKRVDSLSRRMDFLLLSGSDRITLSATLDSLRNSMSYSRHPDAARIQFFETETISNRAMRALKLRRLMDLTSQEDNPYLYHRILHSIHTADPNTAESYRAFLGTLAYFRQTGDSLMTAMAYANLTAMMTALSDSASAYEYWKRADHIFRLIGSPELIARNRINLVVIYENSGNKAKATAENVKLISDTVLKSDEKVRELILRNHFVLTDSVEYLKEILSRLSGREAFTHLRGLHQSMLSDWYRRNGKMDSALAHGLCAMREYDKVYNLGYRVLIMKNYAQLMKQYGHLDSTVHYMERAEAVMDSLRASQDMVTVKNLDLQRRIAAIEYEDKQKMQRHTMWWVIASLIIIILGLSAWLILYKRHVMLGEDMEHQAREKEETERREAAKTLAVHEKETMLRKLKSDIETLSSDDNVSTDDIRQLKNLLIISDSDSDDWTNYIQMAEKINPNFIHRLKQHCPNLSANNIRLACCIYCGMTNRQIAHLTKIRAESVHQARWRLRRKLGVDSEEKLDELLNSLGEQEERN